MNQTQDVIHYLGDQQWVSGMKPGDQPENSLTMALKIPLICKSKNRRELSGKPSFLMCTNVTWALPLISRQHGGLARLWGLGSGRAGLKPCLEVTSALWPWASHFASLSLPFFLVICEVVINALSFPALTWRCHEITDAENWAQAWHAGSPR